MEQIAVRQIHGADYPYGEHFYRNYWGAQKLIDAFYNIKEFQGQPKNFIGSGASGIIMATMFASREPERSFVIAIRKKGEESHHDNVDISLNGLINVIVDDFVQTGSTVNYIYDQLKAEVQSNIHIHAICTQGFSRRKFYTFKADYEISIGDEK